MAAVGGEMPVYDDTTQDMLLARDGMASGVFHGGSGTTFDAIRQGELWIRFLAGTFSVGLGVVGQHVITIALAALSLAIFDQRVRTYFGQDIGWAPIGVFLPLMLVASVYPIATAGYLGAPLLVASTLALVHVATTGSTVTACLCGASLAFAAELHPVTLLGVPVFVVTVLMSCRRPIRALALGIASGIAAALAVSFHTWLNNARVLLNLPWCMALMAGGLALALLIGARGRPRWLALDVERRRLLLLVGILGTIMAEVTAASTIGPRMLLMPHYFIFGFPALAILTGLGLRRLRTRGGVARVVALAVPLVLLSLPLLISFIWRYGMSTGTTSIPNYSMREAEVLARHFWAEGYSFPDVQRHLRGPDSLDLMGGIAVFAPSADGPLERPMVDLRVLAFSERNRPDGPIPVGGEEVYLGRGRRAWILPLDGWIRLAPSRVCFEGLSTVDSESDCIDIASDSIAYSGRYRDLHERAFPALREGRSDGRSRPGGQRFRWELPIEIIGNDEERHVDIVGLIGVPPWMIERVDGVAYRGELPARHVVLERSGRRSGRLVLAARPSGMTLRDYPPDFLETRPGEAVLRRSLQRLPPLGRRVCEPLGTCPDRTPD
jgi:hypothetical protein